MKSITTAFAAIAACALSLNAFAEGSSQEQKLPNLVCSLMFNNGNRLPKVVVPMVDKTGLVIAQSTVSVVDDRYELQLYARLKGAISTIDEVKIEAKDKKTGVTAISSPTAAGASSGARAQSLFLADSQDQSLFIECAIQ